MRDGYNKVCLMKKSRHFSHFFAHSPRFLLECLVFVLDPLLTRQQAGEGLGVAPHYQEDDHAHTEGAHADTNSYLLHLLPPTGVERAGVGGWKVQVQVKVHVGVRG